MFISTRGVCCIRAAGDDVVCNEQILGATFVFLNRSIVQKMNTNSHITNHSGRLSMWARMRNVENMLCRGKFVFSHDFQCHDSDMFLCFCFIYCNIGKPVQYFAGSNNLLLLISFRLIMLRGFLLFLIPASYLI